MLVEIVDFIFLFYGSRFYLLAVVLQLVMNYLDFDFLDIFAHFQK